MKDGMVACRDCHQIVSDSEAVCTNCGSNRLSDDWDGYVVITLPDDSEVAEMMDIRHSGEYAVKVR